MSAAAQLAFDFRPPGLMQRRDVPACAKLFWSEIQCRGGSVTEAGVLELAVAIGVNKSTISRSAAVLESTGWMASAKRQGHPKTYRCLHGAALPESSTDQGQDKSQKADTQNADTQNADTQNADTQNADTQPRNADGPADGRRQGVGVGEGVHPAIDRSKVLVSVIDIQSNRTGVESIENPPETERLSQNRFDTPTLRQLSEERPDEISDIQDKMRTVAPHLTKPLDGKNGDPAAAQCLQMAISHGDDFVAVKWAIDQGYKNREGKNLPPITSPGWFLTVVRDHLGIEKKPPKRETRRAPPQKVAVGQAGQAADPDYSRRFMADMMANGAGS